jgi:hypothetical protein
MNIDQVSEVTFLLHKLWLYIIDRSGMNWHETKYLYFAQMQNNRKAYYKLNIKLLKFV